MANASRAGRLEGKVAIVTGGGAGIGRATAELYAREGAKVIIGDVRDDVGQEACEAINTAGGTCAFRRIDVSSAADNEALVAFAVEKFGQLDILTANAGIVGRALQPLHESKLEDLETVFAINSYGVLYACKYAISAMLRTGGGVISVTSSLASERGINGPGYEIYSASKAAVNGMIRSLTAQYSPQIRLNAVAPGRVATDLIKFAAADTDRIPVGEPLDLAYAHLFLVSPESKFVRGQVLAVDGGRGILDIA